MLVAFCTLMDMSIYNRCLIIYDELFFSIVQDLLHSGQFRSCDNNHDSGQRDHGYP